MAEAVVEPRTRTQRFFCHRCNVEFEDVVQDFLCPFCSLGFIEQLDETLSSTLDEEDYSDAGMSNLEDTSRLGDGSEGSENPTRASNATGPPMINDLAFLMTGGRIGPGAGVRRVEGSRSLLEQLVVMIGGGRGNVNAGAPFVLVGAPGDYVFGGEGLDAVVTQLLGQLENTGPPPLPREQIQAIPSDTITAEQVDSNMSCSVCWDNFTLGETVSRLECEHIFHPGCITPWLQLHATCPICRRSLLAEEPAPAPAPALSPSDLLLPPPDSADGAVDPDLPRDALPAGYSRVVVRRVGARRRRGAAAPEPRGLWAALTSQLASAADSAARPARPADPMYMDIDFD